MMNYKKFKSIYKLKEFTKQTAENVSISAVNSMECLIKRRTKIPARVTKIVLLLQKLVKYKKRLRRIKKKHLNESVEIQECKRRMLFKPTI